MDQITLSGVTAVGHHGVFDFERRNGQPFVVDAVLHLDFRPAAASDDVLDTAHYGEVAECIRGWITGEPLNLIEALAVRIAEDVLRKFPIDAVDITVHKPKAPIEVEFGDVSVSVRRTRQEQP
ncbi:dihydroneopterin aldolase [Arthrobacter sp. PsM3]|jgi:dihydroneopterin aldolase|uniref:dihydroneopterin aldolase n=1 Tax=Arthrobacter sp. PsM3 TaxID=3030531 RepID=UPI00263B02EC|nr:dihydroneopterin aldolase [Arthrobacter sp. PsM3]MDN4643773.1 dihydroneopterin aldolase [Arthrobacter sp. PsM3]